MKIFTAAAVAASMLIGGYVAPAFASPADDIQTYRNYFKERFPKVPMDDYANGVYSVDPNGRQSWEAIEEFPPYEPMIEDGQALWEKPFGNGKGYKNCFADGPALRGKYPYWDSSRQMVMTLPLALNECREANGEKKLKYKKGKMASLLAYISYESRGQKVDVAVPNDPAAMAAYEDGKRFFFARRGQLNLACAHCHMRHAGQKLRADVLSPALGHTTGWPVYRSKWGNLGTLHRRYAGCNKQVRAKPFKAQGPEYRNLEYFMTHMSNGLEYNGPSSRK